MNNWQPIKTAPKNGKLICSAYKGLPVFVAWIELPAPKIITFTGWWPLKKQHESEGKKECGWRILLLCRDLSYSIHGNYGPVELTHWLPFPDENLSHE